MDVSKLENAGWRYKIKLEEGIKSVYEQVLESGKLN
jgi:nucleoside-diphosphate-sugar epimerase